MVSTGAKEGVAENRFRFALERRAFNRCLLIKTVGNRFERIETRNIVGAFRYLSAIFLRVAERHAGRASYTGAFEGSIKTGHEGKWNSMFD